MLLLAALNDASITDSAMKKLLRENDAVLELLRGLLAIADHKAWKIFRGVKDRSSIETAASRLRASRKDGEATLMSDESRLVLEALNNPAISDADMRQLLRDNEDGVLALLRDLILLGTIS
jgi:hypothetical protein